MKKAIIISFLMIGHFAISQNDVNIKSENSRRLSANQKNDGLFQNKINRQVTKREEGDTDASRLHKSTKKQRAGVVYKESSSIENKNTNMKISRRIVPSERARSVSDRMSYKDSSFVENKNANFKMSRRVLPIEREQSLDDGLKSQIDSLRTRQDFLNTDAQN